MPDKQLSAGDIIESRCTKCRTVMNHTIVAMVDNAPGRVECNTCKGVHNYRKPVADKPKTAKRTTTTRAKVAARSDTAAFAALGLDADDPSATPYAMQTSYQVGQVVRHPQFGIGQVLQLLPPNKVEILFADGKKLLRCG